MGFAFRTAEMSTCARVRVGAVVARRGRIITMGYNGSAPGRPHCEEIFPEPHKQGFVQKHHDWALRNELHAEENAIVFAARIGASTADADIFITHQPCITCSKLIVQAGIKRVFYRSEYNGEIDMGILKDNNVEVIKL
jgi:dCMP deaminase